MSFLLLLLLLLLVVIVVQCTTFFTLMKKICQIKFVMMTELCCSWRLFILFECLFFETGVL